MADRLSGKVQLANTLRVIRYRPTRQGDNRIETINFDTPISPGRLAPNGPQEPASLCVLIPRRSPARIANGPGFVPSYIPAMPSTRSPTVVAPAAASKTANGTRVSIENIPNDGGVGVVKHDMSSTIPSPGDDLGPYPPPRCRQPGGGEPPNRGGSGITRMEERSRVMRQPSQDQPRR